MDRKIIFQLFCVFILFVTHVKLSYDFNGAWWHSSLGFALILLFGYLTWGRAFTIVSGLKISWRALAGSIVMAVVVLLIAIISMDIVAKGMDVELAISSPENYIHNAVYIINEEIILGSMLLYLVTHRLKLSPLAASALLAFIVALAHLVLYKVYFRDKGFLELTTMATLFLTVFVKNNLILQFRHIGYAWALHFGWMAVMYGSAHYHASGRTLTDLEKFNMYLGSTGILIVSAMLAALSYLFFKKQVKRNFLNS